LQAFCRASLSFLPCATLSTAAADVGQRQPTHKATARHPMGIFDRIKASIFGHHDAPAAPASTPPSAGITGGSSSTAPAAPSTPASASASAATMPTVDVEAMLEAKAKTYSHPVNWRESIVDLMALLGIDNSLAERRALARELGYTGDLNDTAPMNIWLHKQVMRKLAENGGKVPADLLD
jgi:Domain of unknown function (DUF3597)